MLQVLSLSPTCDLDAINVNHDMFNALKDALYCLLENCCSRCNYEWQPVVLEQALVGFDDYELLGGLIQENLLVDMS